MKLDHPAASQHSALKELWKEAFHDTDASVDAFFRTGFAPSRCRCITVDGELAAALYWLDMTCRGQRVAYIYAVATKKAFQGRGLCRALMENTHIFLRSRGYDTCVLHGVFPLRLLVRDPMQRRHRSAPSAGCGC